MFVRNWGKSLFCVLLVCVVFLSLSFSFAAEDMGLYLEDNYEDNVDLSVSNDEVCSDLKCSFDSDENVLEDDGDGDNISLSTILIICGVSYALSSFYIVPNIINQLTKEHTIDYIKIEFNETTNKTEIIIYYK